MWFCTTMKKLSWNPNKMRQESSQPSVLAPANALHDSPGRWGGCSVCPGVAFAPTPRKGCQEGRFSSVLQALSFGSGQSEIQEPLNSRQTSWGRGLSTLPPGQSLKTMLPLDSSADCSFSWTFPLAAFMQPNIHDRAWVHHGAT